MIRMVVQVAVVLVVTGLALSSAASAEPLAAPAGMAQDLAPAKIFTLLFLMLGPFKIIGPFAQLTKGADARLAHRIAWMSIGFASAALLVAAALGGAILDSYGIPVPVMALTGGLVLFLVALKNLLQQFEAQPDAGRPDAAPPELKVAMMPLAFPTIVTPYGIAAVVVLMAVSPAAQGRWMVGGIVVAIMLANLRDHDAGAEDPAGHGHRAADPRGRARRGAGGAGPADHQQRAHDHGCPVSSPELNTATVLAIERTRVAYERTMMAWVRTGTSLIAFGFTVYKFFQLGAPAAAAARSPIGPREFAIGLLLLGLLSLVLGTVEHARDLRSLRALRPDLPRSLSGLVAIVMGSLGLAALVAVILNA